MAADPIDARMTAVEKTIDRIDTRLDAMRTELVDLRIDLNKSLGDIRSELHQSLGAMHAAMHDQTRKLLGLMFALAGLLYAAHKLLP